MALRWMQDRFNRESLDNPRLDAELLLAETINGNRLQVLTRADQPLTQGERGRLREMIQRRLNREPVAYILGRKAFRDFEVVVGPGVLVPRPESEFILDAVVELDRQGRIPDGAAADLGSGSGILAIGLSGIYPDRQIQAIEQSETACTYLRQNLERLAPSVDLVQTDWLDWAPAEKYALIVSNPPYVPDSDLDTLAPEVRQEPVDALVAGVDGLDAIRQQANLLHDRLETGGVWVCEAGIGQKAAISALTAQSRWQVLGWWQDYGGIPRVFAATPMVR